jgi:hypothetical protein
LLGSLVEQQVGAVRHGVSLHHESSLKWCPQASRKCTKATDKRDEKAMVCLVRTTKCQGAAHGAQIVRRSDYGGRLSRVLNPMPGGRSNASSGEFDWEPAVMNGLRR